MKTSYGKFPDSIQALSTMSFGEIDRLVDRGGDSSSIYHKALEEVLRIERNEGQKTIYNFSILRQVKYGEEVIICGSIAELGDWDPDAAPRLSWSKNHLWAGAVTRLAEMESFEYKYVVKTNSGEYVWEDGENRKFFPRKFRGKEMWTKDGLKLFIADK
eukprot:CAMPEP_0114979418 /NCGR_PEP_ID=MMETSP0216-20121206/4358_1 /TAXON_ID=223996 /ORGANISM="Protocruzia adherens, Strain Boccale" /LENGTH=158 /DNA_ID=CAMNT_0002340737 /DNA_START=240 /DNA_END=716 /DNA_ORIENTATION=-